LTCAANVMTMSDELSHHGNSDNFWNSKRPVQMSITAISQN